MISINERVTANHLTTVNRLATYTNQFDKIGYVSSIKAIMKFSHKSASVPVNGKAGGQSKKCSVFNPFL
jgi:hypothetical protein